ncbi:hypothetical protein [Inhella gelatinilytica]|uniref:Uncharacterized protein n=1 Tax=Inhella gelatinilytica TaxID=2795030 RepID=A0A931IX12_9BURK|nr:hypothetical protein [Inhella gelatinilytica]MBH9554392.1 hypothetical protein [Inhella gelatinilytica]
MEARDWISLAALYVAIYYTVARIAMKRLRTIDHDYFAKLGAKSDVGMSNSIAIGKMLFDSELPKQSYPAGVSRMIVAARYMLFFSPVVLIGAVALANIVG